MSSENRVCYVKVKRKTTDEVSNQNKRFKYIGSTTSNKEDEVQEVIKNTTGGQEFEVVDYESSARNKRLAPLLGTEAIQCNGVPLSKVENEGWVYDIFVVDSLEDELVKEEDVLDDASSCDENYPYNDYPDDADYDYEEYDFYREWEDDEDREMTRNLEKTHLNDEESDSDSNDL